VANVPPGTNNNFFAILNAMAKCMNFYASIYWEVAYTGADPGGLRGVQAVQIPHPPF
jgi:hypothetical protein